MPTHPHDPMALTPQPSDHHAHRPGRGTELKPEQLPTDSTPVSPRGPGPRRQISPPAPNNPATDPATARRCSRLSRRSPEPTKHQHGPGPRDAGLAAAAPTTNHRRLPRARRCWRGGRGAVRDLPQRQQVSPTTTRRWSSPAGTPQPRHPRGRPVTPTPTDLPTPRRHTKPAAIPPPPRRTRRPATPPHHPPPQYPHRPPPTKSVPADARLARTPRVRTHRCQQTNPPTIQTRSGPAAPSPSRRHHHRPAPRTAPSPPSPEHRTTGHPTHRDLSRHLQRWE